MIVAAMAQRTGIVASPLASPAGAPRLNAGACLECGGDLVTVGTNGTFCTSRCRAAWNNRRLQRGAELYDLVMTLRFDRRRARGLGILTAICRAAAAFRELDRREREGRRSWCDVDDVLARKPYLRARVMQRLGR